MDIAFKAFLVTENQGVVSYEIKELTLNQLPDNDVLIRVTHSSINYKDALSAKGNRGVTRKYPHVPGIDAAGTIVMSKNNQFTEGMEVIVTGFDLGMNTWGGFGQFISVPYSWVILLPSGMSAKTAMSFGTAGLTAGLSVYHLLKAGLTPQLGEVAISGATGGVGSIATAILSKLGFSTVAITGKSNNDSVRGTLGAARSIDRDEFIASSNAKALNEMAFSGAVDCVGGEVLSGLLKSLNYNGVITCCGMIASTELTTSIFPFILRGISLIGVDSVLAPIDLRKDIWHRLASSWLPANLPDLVHEIRIEQIEPVLKKLASGEAKGRYVIKHT